MATKTFKIGEYAVGGVITAIATQDKITIIGKNWDTSTGYKKSSNQTNAKEFDRLEVRTNDRDADRKLSNFLCRLTTAYYCDMVLAWVYSKTKITSEMY